MPLHRLPLADMQAIEPRITDDVFTVLSVDQFGEEPRQLRRHRAEKRPGAGQALAEEAGQGARADVRRAKKGAAQGRRQYRSRGRKAVLVGAQPADRRRRNGGSIPSTNSNLRKSAFKRLVWLECPARTAPRHRGAGAESWPRASPMTERDPISPFIAALLRCPPYSEIYRLPSFETARFSGQP